MIQIADTYGKMPLCEDPRIRIEPGGVQPELQYYGQVAATRLLRSFDWQQPQAMSIRAWISAHFVDLLLMHVCKENEVYDWGSESST